jgi:hypothetical protein
MYIEIIDDTTVVVFGETDKQANKNACAVVKFVGDNRWKQMSGMLYGKIDEPYKSISVLWNLILDTLILI